jgi:hypothetical protein
MLDYCINYAVQVVLKNWTYSLLTLAHVMNSKSKSKYIYKTSNVVWMDDQNSKA